MPNTPPAVVLEPPSESRQEEFLRLVAASSELHSRWVSPPSTPDAYLAYLERCRADTCQGYFVCDRTTNELCGVINFSEIVLGCFQNAYIGFYGFSPSARKGLMRAGASQALTLAFSDVGLHRVEANVQPDNVRSLSLVKSLGFRKEGYSPSYLKIAGAWRDHQRWAMLAEDWSATRAGG